MKPRIFMGSSSENLATLEKVAKYFESFGDCKLWTSAFRNNMSGLESLVRETKLSDFSILLATSDDILHKRKVAVPVARDNVIFEFALFLGSTGLRRAFLLAEEGIDLPSDLSGITLFKFTKEDGKYNSLDKICANILELMKEVTQSSELGLLPSTALAIGYYFNFVQKVCEELHQDGIVKEGDKKFKVKEFKLHIIIPDDLEHNGVDSFRTIYNKKHGLNGASTGSVETKRGFPFHFKLEPPDQKEDDDKIVDIYDIPTTLNTIVEAIKLYMPRIDMGTNAEMEFLEKRELANFSKVLKYLISKSSFTKDHVVVEDNVKFDK